MLNAPRRARPAFTLIELLVVIAIIGILMALLLPAVQKVREAANKMICANNLQQIATAFHSYHNDFNALPTAGNYDSGNAPTNRADWGWAYEILPYIEQSSLYDNKSNSQVRRTPLKLYYCTSRRAAKLYGNWAKCDYAGNGATRVANDGFDGLVVKSLGSLESFKRGPIRIKQGLIPDGVSNTLLVGEKHVNLATMGGGTSTDGTGDWSDNESWAGPGFADGDIMRGCRLINGNFLTPAKDLNDPSFSGSLMGSLYRFGSSHVMGMNAVFGDRSAKTIKFTIRPEVFRLCCVRNDGQPYNLDDL